MEALFALCHHPQPIPTTTATAATTVIVTVKTIKAVVDLQPTVIMIQLAGSTVVFTRLAASLAVIRRSLGLKA